MGDALPAGNGQAGITDAPATTFNRDIAPLVWDHCADCHRPGEAAPFSLLTYEDVRKRADQILEVTSSRYMPPWLAEDTDFALEDDLKLREEELATLRAWVAAGAPEGRAEDLPTAPRWPDGWSLGPPDLVVRMDQPFRLQADGPDVYRNFIIPVPLDRPRYVRAMEFRPGNHRIVHHAFVLTDPSKRLRRLEDQDGQPGFAGMETQGAEPPNGHFIGWQPGRRPYEAPEGMAWRLVPETDLVVQVHMQPIGKEESLSVSIGFYFTDVPPTKQPMKIGLRSIEIDIPAGVSDYSIHDEFQLPVDVEVLAVAPHAHYLGKEMFGKAILPDGTQKTLFAIHDWDPNWQREYRYRKPIRLPAGTKLVQDFVYDNSAQNPRNPHSPPQRVRYGLQATDEMGSLWFQVLPKDATDLAALERAIAVKGIRESQIRFAAVLRKNPDDVRALVEVAKIALIYKNLEQADKLLRRAVKVEPNSADAHYYLGQVLLRLGNTLEGRSHLEQTIALDERYVKAHHDLGWADVLVKDWKSAEQHFQDALTIQPFDSRVLEKLGIALINQGRFDEAVDCLERAISGSPNQPSLRKLLEKAQSAARN